MKKYRTLAKVVKGKVTLDSVMLGASDEEEEWAAVLSNADDDKWESRQKYPGFIAVEVEELPDGTLV